MALRAVLGAVGLGMTAACADAPESADYFDTPEPIAAADHIRRGNATGLETMIAEGLDVNLRGREGADLLKWSLLSGCPDCLEALLEGGARTDHVPAGKYTGKVEQLLLKPVMHLAASAKDPRYLSLLLRHGGDPGRARCLRPQYDHLRGDTQRGGSTTSGCWSMRVPTSTHGSRAPW